MRIVVSNDEITIDDDANPAENSAISGYRRSLLEIWAQHISILLMMLENCL